MASPQEDGNPSLVRDLLRVLRSHHDMLRWLSATHEVAANDESAATAASSADASALADTVALVPAMPTPGGTLADVAGAVDANERHNVRLARVAARLPPRRMRVGPTMGGGYGTSLEGGCGPFSSSSLKAQRKGTRFPSAAVLIEEEHVRNMYNIALDLTDGDNLCIDLPPDLGNDVNK